MLFHGRTGALRATGLAQHAAVFVHVEESGVCVCVYFTARDISTLLFANDDRSRAATNGLP